MLEAELRDTRRRRRAPHRLARRTSSPSSTSTRCSRRSSATPSAAVGGKDFALLVDEDGALRCAGVDRRARGRRWRRIEAWVAAPGTPAETDPRARRGRPRRGAARAAARRTRRTRSARCACAPLVYRGATRRPPRRARARRPGPSCRATSTSSAPTRSRPRSRSPTPATSPRSGRSPPATRSPACSTTASSTSRSTRELERCRRHGGDVRRRAVRPRRLQARQRRRAATPRATASCAAVADALGRGVPRVGPRVPHRRRRVRAAAARDRPRGGRARVVERVRRRDRPGRRRGSAARSAWPRGPTTAASKDVLLAARRREPVRDEERRPPAPRAGAGRRRPAEQRAAAGALLRERLAVAGRLARALVDRARPRADRRRGGRRAAPRLRLPDRLRPAAARTSACGCWAVGGTLTETHDVPKWSHPVSEGISGRVARTGATALVHDTALDPDHLGARHVDPGLQPIARPYRTAKTIHLDHGQLESAPRRPLP